MANPKHVLNLSESRGAEPPSFARLGTRTHVNQILREVREVVGRMEGPAALGERSNGYGPLGIPNHVLRGACTRRWSQAVWLPNNPLTVIVISLSFWPFIKCT